MLNKYKISKHYENHTFDSPDSPGTYKFMDLKTIQVLDNLIDFLGFNLKVSSAFRTTYHNQYVGGVKNSAHTKGLAIDIIIPNSHTRYRVVEFLLNNNVNRIGVYTNFIHFDIDKSKPSNVIWTGK